LILTTEIWETSARKSNMVIPGFSVKIPGPLDVTKSYVKNALTCIKESTCAVQNVSQLIQP
jgi:hypothetical protein